MESRIILIRHGITEGNKKRWFYGAADIPLSQEGREELIEQKADGLYPDVPDGAQFVTSGLVRTEETLELLYGNVRHTVLSDLQEMSFGDYECRAFEELTQDELFLEWGYDRTGELALPNGESRNAFAERISRGMAELVALHERHEVTVAICHGGVISAMLQDMFPGKYETMWSWMPRPGCGYTVYMEGDRPVRSESFGRVGDSLQDAINGYNEDESAGGIF